LRASPAQGSGEQGAQILGGHFDARVDQQARRAGDGG
jgi:hypothetical protein